MQWSAYSKRKLARTALIAAKINIYGKHVPVPERYFRGGAAHSTCSRWRPTRAFSGAGGARADSRRWLAERGLDRHPFAALAPGAAHTTKRWPIRHWVALAEQLRTMGYGLVAVGGPGGATPSSPVSSVPVCTAPRESSRCQETGACLARAAVVVSGDTGVMHMGKLLSRTRVVALFGPTVELFGFFPYGGRAEVLERDLGCRPCSVDGDGALPARSPSLSRGNLPDEVAAAVQRLVA